MMIDWNERKEDLKHDSFLNSYFINKYEKAIDNIIIFEKQILKECREKFEEQNKQLLEALKEVCEDYDNDRPVRIGKYYQLIETIEENILKESE